MATLQTAEAPVVHPHYFRTFFSAIFGIIAMVLILASILVVWLNRTLLDTTTYVNTVAPVVNQVDVQNYVADQATSQLLINASAQDLATQLLPADQITGKTDQELQAELKPVIDASVLQVVQSASFADLWRTTNQSAHAQLIAQLNSNSNKLTLDLSPAVTGVVNQFKMTKLNPISDKIASGSPNAVLNLKGSAVDQVYYYYKLFKQLSILLILVTLFSILICVVISVHHVKTLRRIIFGTGLLSLFLVILLEVPTFVSSKLDGLDQKAALAVAEVLLRNLQIAALILAVVCFILSIGSKFHPKFKSGLKTS